MTFNQFKLFCILYFKSYENKPFKDLYGETLRCCKLFHLKDISFGYSYGYYTSRHIKTDICLINYLSVDGVKEWNFEMFKFQKIQDCTFEKLLADIV